MAYATLAPRGAGAQGFFLRFFESTIIMSICP
jgi:hypothetical protein